MQLKIIFQCLLCAFYGTGLSAQTDLIPFRKGNLWGFSKPDKTIVILCQYDEVHFFENHKALIRKGLLYGLIDETGREVYPCQSYIPIVYHCGRARIAKTQKTLSGNNRLGIPFQVVTDYGFINEKGVEIIPCIYKLADDFHENYAFASKEGEFKISVPQHLDFVGPRVYYAGKGGFIDTNGKPIGDFDFPAGLHFPVFQNGLAIVQKGNLFGIINTQNQVIAPFMYYQLNAMEGGFRTTIVDKYGWLDIHGREILPTIYEAVVRSFPHLTVKQRNKFGLFDSTGRALLPFNYEQPFDFQEDRTLLVENGKYGFADLQGKIIVKPHYAKAEPFREGKTKITHYEGTFWLDKQGNYVLENQQLFTRFAESGQLGIKNKQHKIVLPLAAYGELDIVSNRYAILRQNNKGALYDMQKEKLITPYDSVFIYYLASKDAQVVVFPIYQNGLYGFLNEKGELITPCAYELPWQSRRLERPIVQEGDLKIQQEGAFQMILLRKNKKYGALDAKTGKIMISFSYDKPFRFINGKALVSKNGQIGIIDRYEKELLPIQYTLPYYHQDSLTFREGLTALCKGQKVGFIDSTYQEIIPFEYERTAYQNTFFTHGLAAVVKKDKQNNDKFGFINRKNQVIIPFEFIVAHAFEGGFARLYEGGKVRFIDTTGKPITDWMNGSATAFQHQVSIVTVNGGAKYLINLKGERISEDYAEIENWQIDSRYFYLQVKAHSQEGKKGLYDYGLLDTTGKIVLPVQFENFYLYNKHFYLTEQNKGNYSAFIHVKTGKKIEGTTMNLILPSLYITQNNEGMGLVDSLGQIVYPITPHTSFQLHQNHFWVTKNTGTEYGNGLLNQNGKILLSCVYNMILRQDTALNAPFLVQDKAGKWGIVDSKTYQFTILCQYDYIQKVQNDLYRVKNQEVMYYVHSNGTTYFLQ